MSSRQMQFDFVASVPLQAELISAVEAMAAAGVEQRGAIFTRRSVVDFMLDLTGYTADKPLYKTRLLEPAFGNGDFLLPVVKRLLDSWKGFQNLEGPDFAELDHCLCAVELHIPTFEDTKAKLLALLTDNDIPKPVAMRLLEGWLIQNDFLLTEFSEKFDFVVGNPPYVRQERISDVLLSAYRKRFSTLYDRADLYVPFIEYSLKLLKKGGTLGFICSDRWMKNRYGGPLREMISRDYHLKVYVDMVDTDAFHSEVTAYPAITIISRQTAGATRIAHWPEINAGVFRKLSQELSAPKVSGSAAVREIKGVTNGKEPWILDSSDQLAVIRRLEQCFPTLEEAGCKVGIGVATGADSAFIGPFTALDVEADRKIPLVMTKDIENGELKWRGLGVINPFADPAPTASGKFASPAKFRSRSPR